MLLVFISILFFLMCPESIANTHLVFWYKTTLTTTTVSTNNQIKSKNQTTGQRTNKRMNLCEVKKLVWFACTSNWMSVLIITKQKLDWFQKKLFLVLERFFFLFTSLASLMLFHTLTHVVAARVCVCVSFIFSIFFFCLFRVQCMYVCMLFVLLLLLCVVCRRRRFFVCLCAPHVFLLPLYVCIERETEKKLLQTACVWMNMCVCVYSKVFMCTIRGKLKKTQTHWHNERSERTNRRAAYIHIV